jgi:hypothetical protein
MSIALHHSSFSFLISYDQEKKLIGIFIRFPIFGIIVLLYHIKLDGWNPLNWRFRASEDLERPRPMIVKRGERRGRLRVENPNKLTMSDLAAFVHWIWVWMK